MADVEQDIIVRADTSGAVSGLNAARDAMERETQAAQASVVPHRAAHQALALVSSEMARMAGASQAGEAATRVFDSVLFSMVMTGGAVSVGFIAATAAAVGLSSMLTSMSKTSSDAAKELDGLVKKNTEAAMQADKLDASQRKLAATHAAELQPKLEAATSKLQEAREALAGMVDEQEHWSQAYAHSNKAQQASMDGTKNNTAEISKQIGVISTLDGEYKKLQAELTAATLASKGMGKSLRELDGGPAYKQKTTNQDQAADMAIKQYEQHLQDLAKTSADVAAKMQKNIGSAASFIGHSAGMAFGKMVVEGKSATEAFKGFAQTMAEDFIAKVSAMILKWLALKAIMAMTGVGGLPIPGFASGFSGVVSGPTPMMVGEGGEPEHVTVTPLSQMGGSGGSGGSGGGNVSIGQIVIQGITDPKAIAQQVGLEIAKAVRGRGQIGMTGPGLYGT